MIKPLRQRHFQIWTLWSVLMPVGIISAVLVRPEFAKDKLLQPETTAALPLVLKSADKDEYTVNIRISADTSQVQLEWINKKTLTHPTATIYETNEETKSLNGALLIGRIEARGAYHFTLPRQNIDSYHFLLYDFVHDQIIDSITL